jgi:hypothetical protein
MICAGPTLKLMSTEIIGRLSPSHDLYHKPVKMIGITTVSIRRLWHTKLGYILRKITRRRKSQSDLGTIRRRFPLTKHFRDCLDKSCMEYKPQSIQSHSYTHHHNERYLSSNHKPYHLQMHIATSFDIFRGTNTNRHEE